MNRTTLRAALTADWAPAIEATVRAIAAAAVACYCAGYALGAWIHDLNDKLAHRQAAAPAPRPPAAPAAVHPLAALAADLQALPAARLRALAGVRSKRARKADLAALLVGAW